MTKICSKCGMEKNISDFGKELLGKDGLCSRCKSCVSLYYKERHEKIKEVYNEKQREYRKNNPEKVLEYRAKTKDIRKEQVKEYKEKHRKEISEYQRNYRNDKRKTDKKRNIRDRFSCLMRNHMKNYILEGKGNSSWTSFVDYTADDLLEHLGEKAFQKGYEIDHIIPVSLYDFKEMGDAEFRKCWGLKNLRMITKKENSIKGNNLDMNLVKEYNIFDLLPMRFQEV